MRSYKTPENAGWRAIRDADRRDEEFHVFRATRSFAENDPSDRFLVMSRDETRSVESHAEELRDAGWTEIYHVARVEPGDRHDPSSARTATIREILEEDVERAVEELLSSEWPARVEFDDFGKAERTFWHVTDRLPQRGWKASLDAGTPAVAISRDEAELGK